ncbi:MAG: 4Fe-4S dicluster domain-containing protein [Candidatus Bipolaricaulia bacterium]
MEIYSLSEWDLKKLVNNLSEDNYIFLPVFCQQKEGPRSRWEYVRWDPKNTRFQLNCRSTDALCNDFFFPPNNILHTFPEGQPGEEGKSLALLGYKSCDIAGLEVLDAAFEKGELSYPFYEKRREETTIITCDCLEIADSCFCNKLGGQPYPESGFDLNVSMLPHYGDMLIEVGEDSEKGHEIVDRYGHLLTEATEKQIELRESRRKKMSQKIDEKNDFLEIDPDLGKVPRDAPFWEKYASKNRYCTAFTLACPTSLTLHRVEEENGKSVVKDKVWDSATQKDIHQELRSDDPTDSRIKEMFYDKFKRAYDEYGDYGCSGCGSCISVTSGKMDIRDIIADASNYTG